MEVVSMQMCQDRRERGLAKFGGRSSPHSFFSKCDSKKTGIQYVVSAQDFSSGLSRYYHLLSVDNLDYGATLNNTKMLNSRQNFSSNKDAITSTADITDCLRRHHIDSTIHLAAHSNVDASLKKPESFPSTKIVGTQALSECAKHAVSRHS